PLDDIHYAAWNCAAGRAACGDPGRASAARAQSDLLSPAPGVVEHVGQAGWTIANQVYQALPGAEEVTAAVRGHDDVGDKGVPSSGEGEERPRTCERPPLGAAWVKSERVSQRAAG
ncbi:hypothetical protein CLM82_05945, partial [Streptomyces albidoflavus]